MKEKNVERKELFKALFEDKDFTKKQLKKARESVRKQRLSKKEEEKLKKIKELQYRLKARRRELLTKSFGTYKISEDQKVKDLVNNLKESYADYKKESNEYKLSLKDCPKLPLLSDFMSRIHPDLDNDFPPLLYTYVETDTSGTDDNLYNSDDPDNAVANADEARFHVSANSIKEHPFSVDLPVEARASLFFPLQQRFPVHYSELVVKAHLFGGYEGSQFDDGPLFAGSTNIRAWIKMSLEAWDGYWRPVDSVTVNLMDESHSYSTIPYTSFERTLKLSTDTINERFPLFFRVSLTAGVEALAPPNVSSLFFGQGEINTASAMLDMVLCAVDVGLQPAKLKVPDENGSHPMLDFIER